MWTAMRTGRYTVPEKGKIYVNASCEDFTNEGLRSLSGGKSFYLYFGYLGEQKGLV
jgi:hypothetical protein